MTHAPYYQPKGGWIEIICGSMFSGKTEELIRRVLRPRSRAERVQVFKPKIDDRYAVSQVASHDGGHFEADVIEACGGNPGEAQPRHDGGRDR